MNTRMGEESLSQVIDAEKKLSAYILSTSRTYKEQHIFTIDESDRSKCR